MIITDCGYNLIELKKEQKKNNKIKNLTISATAFGYTTMAAAGFYTIANHNNVMTIVSSVIATGILAGGLAVISNKITRNKEIANRIFDYNLVYEFNSDNYIGHKIHKAHSKELKDKFVLIKK